MHKLKHIINGFVWTIIALYFIIITIVQIPTIQNYIGKTISKTLEQKIGTKVEIKKINVGLLNRIIIDNITIYDQQGCEMLKTSRLSAKINYYELIRNGKFNISSAQIFGFNGKLYQTNDASKPNYQFLIDSLSSKKSPSSKSFDIKINSLLIRNGAFSYDKYDIASTPQQFNPSHIKIANLSAHFILSLCNKDSIIAEMKKLSFKEQSGLTIKNIKFNMNMGRKETLLKDLNLIMPNTSIHLRSGNIRYKIKNGNIDINSINYDGNLDNSKIYLADLKSIIPIFSKVDKSLFLNTKFYGTNNLININEFKLNSKDKSMSLLCYGTIQNTQKKKLNINVKYLKINSNDVLNIIKTQNKAKDKIYDRLNEIGTVVFKGYVDGNRDNFISKGNLSTEIGEIKFDFKKSYRNIIVNIITPNMNLKKITNNNKLGLIQCDIKASATLSNKNSLSRLSAKSNIKKFEYNNYSYQNININGTYEKNSITGDVTINDYNCMLSIVGTSNLRKQDNNISITTKVQKLNPSLLHLTDNLTEKEFSFDATADILLTRNKLPLGNISVNNFIVSNNNKQFKINQVDLLAEKERIKISGDMGYAELIGKFDFSSLTSSIKHIFYTKLPTLFNDEINASNNCKFKAEITSTEFLENIFDIPISIKKPILINVDLNDNKNLIYLNCLASNFSYKNEPYKNLKIDVNTTKDSLITKSSLTKVMNNKHELDLNIDAIATNNKLLTNLKWDNNNQQHIYGTLSTETSFNKNGNKPDILININPSKAVFNDTIWNVLPAKIEYHKGNLNIENFTIEHDQQHIKINGLATRNETDSITIDLRDVDLEYILNLVNFHAVDFDGYTSGKIYVKSVFFDPNAYANLRIKDFCFEKGNLGTLFFSSKWNKSEKQIDINGNAIDNENGEIKIKGFVSPVYNTIDIDFDAKNSNLGFIESFCDAFMSNVNVRGDGNLRLFGPLSNINLTGNMIADGSVHIKPINVDYHFEREKVLFKPDNIIFNSDTIKDRNENIGIVNGSLHHEHLTRMTYDININAKNLLCYDTHTYGDDIFYGTAYGTGLCSIRGGRGRVDIDIDIKPEKNSFIEYDAASPETISKQEYISWRDISSVYHDSITTENTNDTLSNLKQEGFTQLSTISSDLRMNFNINVTPDATLRILMDKNSGDYISLNGNCNLRATYFNKGAFNMFGTYFIDNGLYKLTIQNIIRKEFQFQSGSTIVFGGNPYNSALNLKALYTINGVPLSDLHLGRSFSSNNIRVDCMMNITGTPQSPKIDFDLDLPTVNNDAKQMVKTIINGEEEMNQQVMYLLSVGRFNIQNNDAVQGDNQQSQTSLAMQSLLSGTLSQQINSILGSLVKNNNWSFGANISTGDEGFNNAEYEGLLSGKLLNNRLIINGQFGYRDNANATTSFIGDFDISYLLNPSGNLAIKVYNQTNDRYFTKSSLNTQGIGLMIKKDFNLFNELFGVRRKNRINNK